MKKPLVISAIPLEGTHLIEASAGTGKTYTLTALVLRLIVERGLDLSEIVVVTFTVAATGELKERILARLLELQNACEYPQRAVDPLVAELRDRVGNERAHARVRRAIAEMDRASIFTIHGFASKILSEYALEAGCETGRELGDRNQWMDEIAEDYFSGQIATGSAERFQALGGVSFLGDLKEAFKIAGADGAQLLCPHPQTADALFHRWKEQTRKFQAEQVLVAQLFRELGPTCLEHLVSAEGLNRQTYRIPKIEGEYEALQAYFLSPQIDVPPSLLFSAEKYAEKWRPKFGEPSPPELLVALDGLKSSAEQLLVAQRELRGQALYESTRELLERRSKFEHLQGLSSYDTLLTDLRDALRGAQGQQLKNDIQKDYRVALIDEFQDTDEAQYEIFRTLFGRSAADSEQPASSQAEAPRLSSAQLEESLSSSSGGRALYLIGDPKQAIYAFRGANLETYLRAVQDAGSASYTLDANFRSSSQVLDALNCLFGRSATPFLDPRLLYEPVRCGLAQKQGKVPFHRLADAEGRPQPGLRWLTVDGASKSQEAQLEAAVADLARQLLSGSRCDGRPLRPSDFAILVRSNDKAKSAAEQLAALGIPAVLFSAQPLFDTPEAQDVELFLEALLRPTRLGPLRRALLTPLFGATMAEIVDDSPPEAIAETEASSKLLQLQEQIFLLARRWEEEGIAGPLGEVILAASQRLLQRQGGERSLANYRHLLEELEAESRRSRSGREELLKFLRRARRESSRMEATQQRLDTDQDAVALMTHHRSKGLEFEIVYSLLVPARERPVGQGASCRVDEEIHFDLPLGEELLSRLRAREREEELRLGYVSLTRAKEQVVAVLPQGAKHLGCYATWLDGTEPEEFSEQANQNTGRPVMEVSLSGEAPTRLALTDYLQRARRARLLRPLPISASWSSARVSSFSGLTFLSHQGGQHFTREIDEPIQLSEAAAPPSLDDWLAAPEEVAVDLKRPVTLGEFPRGAQAGDALHAVFEDIPFEKDAAAVRAELIPSILHKRGFDESACALAVAGIEEVLQARLNSQSSEAGTALSDLAPTARIAEMEFHIPVARSGPSQERSSSPSGAKNLSPRALGAALAGSLLFDRSFQEDCPPLLWQQIQGFGDAVAQLRFEQFHGFLRGFIDLIYESEGKFYVLDYKSNDLGPEYINYVPQRLAESMLDHHYFLQAALYTLALHRYLRLCVENYQYREHIGGARYAYIRGMHPDLEGVGVMEFRFEEEAIEALDQLFTHGESA